MPFKLLLPAPYATEGWRAVIYDKEGPEEPHVTVLFKTTAWRISLRSGRFLDVDPPVRQVPKPVLETVLDRLPLLILQWDALHPENVVASPQPRASITQPKRRPRRK